MKLSANTQYYTVSLRTAERLLFSAIELLQETYEEEIHEFVATSQPPCVKTEYREDLFDEIEFLCNLINALKNSRKELARILPPKEAV